MSKSIVQEDITGLIIDMLSKGASCVNNAFVERIEMRRQITPKVILHKKIISDKISSHSRDMGTPLRYSRHRRGNNKWTTQNTFCFRCRRRVKNLVFQQKSPKANSKSTNAAALS